MEHKKLDQLRSVADVQATEAVRVMTRSERIQHWIDLLEREPSRRLHAIP